MSGISAALLLIVATPAVQGLELPVLPAAVETGIARRRPDLAAALAPLKAERAATLAKGAAFDAACGRVLAGSAADAKCGKEFPALLKAAEEHHRNSVEFLAELAHERERQSLIDWFNALAKRLQWTAEEQARLDNALNLLSDDGRDNVTGAQVTRVWQDMHARGRSAEWARAAASGKGPRFQGSVDAGIQSFFDCTVFALANATGEPYGVVAARATKLIREGEWRDAAARAAPQQAIEQGGLWVGEVVMLAEAFGEAEVVNSAAFAATLTAGRSIMVGVFAEGVVFPADGTPAPAHMVALTRTFQRGPDTWFEMIDSNPGPRRRLYLSAEELLTILAQSGVAFRPNASNVPKVPR